MIEVLENKNNVLQEIVPIPEQKPTNLGYIKLLHALEKKMKTLPGVELGDCFPLKHSFAEGVYIRELIIPKGMFCIGQLHQHSYVNCFIVGDMTILTEEGLKRIKAPYTVVSPAGTKRFGYAHSEVVWVTVHPNPTNSMDIDFLEKQIHAVETYNEKDEVNEKMLDKIFFGLANLIIKIDRSYNLESFRELTKKVFGNEKPGFWSNWTKEQQQLYISGDWEAFSRSRGYKEYEIAELKLWIEMLEDGERRGFNPLRDIRDLSLKVSIKSLALDKNNEIEKSTHIPSSKKIPYREEIKCLE